MAVVGIRSVAASDACTYVDEVDMNDGQHP